MEGRLEKNKVLNKDILEQSKSNKEKQDSKQYNPFIDPIVTERKRTNSVFNLKTNLEEEPIEEFSNQQERRYTINERKSVNADFVVVDDYNSFISKEIEDQFDLILNDEKEHKSPMFAVLKMYISKVKKMLHAHMRGEMEVADKEEYYAALIELSQAADGYRGNYTSKATKQKKLYNAAKAISEFTDKELDKLRRKEQGKEYNHRNVGKLPKDKNDDSWIKNGVDAYKNLLKLNDIKKEQFRAIDRVYIDTAEVKIEKKLKVFEAYLPSFEKFNALRQIDYKSDAGLKEKLKKCIKGFDHSLSIDYIAKYENVYKGQFDNLEKEYENLKFQLEKVTSGKVKKELKNPGLEKLIKDDIDKVRENDLTKKENQIEIKSLNKNIDKNLTEEQKNGVWAIDQWIQENLFHGGILGKLPFLGNTFFRTDYSQMKDFLDNLTVRQKLHIYYLIEHGERREPSLESVIKSQNNYIPNLDKFKDIMTSSHGKFLNYLKGKDYIYFHKIGEAMRASQLYENEIEMAGMNEEQLSSFFNPDNEPANKDFSKAVAETYILLNKVCNQETLSVEEKKEIQNEIRKNSNIIIAFEEMQRKTNLDSLKTSNSNRAVNVIKNISTADKALSKVNKTEKILEKIGDLSASFKALDLTASGGNIIGGALTAITAILTFASSVNSASGREIGFNSVKLLSSMSSSAKSTMTAEELIRGGSEALKNNVMANAFGAGVTALKTVTAIYDISMGFHQAHQANKMQDMVTAKYGNDEAITLEKKDARFVQGMYKLGQNMAERRKARGYAVLGSAIFMGASVAGSFTGVTPLVYAGLGLSIGADLLGETIVDYLKKASLNNLMDKTFDNYYKMDVIYNDVFKYIEAKRKSENLGLAPLSEKEKQRIMSELRTKVALSNGFVTKDESMNLIACQYADRTRLVLGLDPSPDSEEKFDEEEKEIYKQFVKTMGLRYNDEKNEPSREAIIRAVKSK